jgi:hypothetical protein
VARIVVCTSVQPALTAIQKELQDCTCGQWMLPGHAPAGGPLSQLQLPAGFSPSLTYANWW